MNDLTIQFDQIEEPDIRPIPELSQFAALDRWALSPLAARSAGETKPRFDSLVETWEVTLWFSDLVQRLVDAGNAMDLVSAGDIDNADCRAAILKGRTRIIDIVFDRKNPAFAIGPLAHNIVMDEDPPTCEPGEIALPLMHSTYGQVAWGPKRLWNVVPKPPIPAVVVYDQYVPGVIRGLVAIEREMTEANTISPSRAKALMEEHANISRVLHTSMAAIDTAEDVMYRHEPPERLKPLVDDMAHAMEFLFKAHDDAAKDSQHGAA